MLNGGYVMVSKNDTDLYKKLNNALTLGKPVLFYENENTCYYIDTISLDGTDIVLTKGGKTITIEADGDITETGNIQEKIYKYLINYEDLNASDDGTGNSYSVYFQYISKKQLPLYNNETLTQDIANEVVDSYEYMMFCEDNAEDMGYFYSEKCNNNCFDVRYDGGEMYIVAGSTIKIKQIF